MHDQPTAARIEQRIRRYRAGALLADGSPWPVKFIIDGRDGRLVMPVPADLITAAELVLWAPAERFDAVQTLLDPDPIEDEYDEARDRYLAYHGVADKPRWIACSVQSVRHEDGVWDGDEIVLTNALRAAEPRILKTLNADKPALAAMCEGMTGVRPAEPVAVGVDIDGIDVRTSVGVLRVEMPRRAADAEDAAAMVRGLLAPGL